LAFALIACAPAAVNPSGGSGGKGGSSGSSSGGAGANGNGGSGSGGSNNGGSNAQGGSSNGGSNNGGSNNGGSAKGGSASGGSNNGGSNNGGSNNGGSNNGGSNNGGNANGGNANGGSNNGGSNNGGSANGGSANGGSNNGGSAAGGSGAGGTSGTGTRPPGYFMTADWNVTKVDWHGCVWTGKDSTVAGSDTSVVPVDFTSGTPNGGPYHINGSVFNDYNSVALLGFNLNEAPTGVATQCANDPTAGTKDGPPTVTMPPSGATGIAVNWSATKLPLTFRIQIQGVKGGSDPTNRWCATITDTNGPSFVPFTAFSTTCWNTTGVKYNNEPIDAVAFLVPGTTTKTPYDITVVGFAPGTSAADAPGKAAACGQLTGTVGSTTASQDASMQRALVTDTTCKKYIINNNNWGQPTSSTQILNYTANSFTIQNTSGSGGGANVVSFPSIYIGANGQIANGTFNTWADSGLPKAISAIKSAQSTFKWSGGNSGGNYNAAYDIWFAKSTPTAGSYNDAISGFIMVWVYSPGQNHPIGNSGSTRSATIGGQAYTVWRGPRNASATGTDGPGRPVISYVANSTNNNFSADLKAFFDDAVANAADDMSKGGGITQAFSSSWLLTDVFAGFEIWNGGDAKGLQDTFTCVIQ
jgi:hypothetical protein